MNIFASYPDPVKSAVVLDDKRVIKMPLESCQMLSTVSSTLGLWSVGMTKPTHAHHPLVAWVGAGRGNFEWLWEHARALDAERRRRWGHSEVHKTVLSCTEANIIRVARHLPKGSTPFINCARNTSLGIDFRHIKDTHAAYRMYLGARWLTQSTPAQCCVRGLLK